MVKNTFHGRIPPKMLRSLCGPNPTPLLPVPRSKQDPSTITEGNCCLRPAAEVAGAVSLGTTDCNGPKTVLKTNVANESDCVTCRPKKSASTKIDKKYYTDSRAYLRARCQTFDQKSKIGDKVDGSTAGFKSTNCYVLSGCENKQNVIYKPSNNKFATQGAVSSGSRLLRLKVDTITRNANSFSAYGHAAQNAGRYNGNSTAPYFLKSKENKGVCFRRNGKMTMCF